MLAASFLGNSKVPHRRSSRSPSAIRALEPAGDAAAAALGAKHGVLAESRFEIAYGVCVIAVRKRHAVEAPCHITFVLTWRDEARLALDEAVIAAPAFMETLC